MRPIWSSGLPFLWPSFAFCVSPVTSQSPRSPLKTEQLCREDIAVGTDCLLVHIKWSKTIQLAERTPHIPVLAIPNSPICLVKAYRWTVDKVPSSSDDPAVCVPNKKGNWPLMYHLFQYWLKQLVHKSGWVAAAFSSHSLRRGWESGLQGQSARRVH